MAEKQLYPVFEVPDFVAKKNEENRKQQYKPLFISTMRPAIFALTAPGAWREPAAASYMQWCIKPL